MRQCSLLLLLLACAALAAQGGCADKDKLPSMPQLGQEDLGTGVHLLSPVEEARQGGKVECLTLEQFQSHSAHDERESGKDLVVALYSDTVAMPGAKEALPLLKITELRAYLAPPDKSQVKLLDQPAAQLDPDDIQTLLGPPSLPLQASADGRTHLVYYFAVEDEPKLAYRLTTSHGVDGACYAIELLLMEKPR